MLKYFLLHFAVIICPAAFAQNALRPPAQVNFLQIEGRAVDESNGAAIPYATINLLRLQDSGFVTGEAADSSGVFRLAGVAPGQYLLALLSMGYGKVYKQISAESGTHLHLGSIYLSPSANQLSEVTIAGAKPPFQRLADKLVLNITGNQLFAVSGNVLDILKKVPGLEVSGDGTIQMSGRITPGVFIDGRPAPMSAEELQNFLRSLTPDMISSIEVINTPSGRYDGEYKGIIDIRLKRDETLGWRGTLSSSLQRNQQTLSENNLSLSYKTGKTIYTARMNYTGGHNIRRYSALQHLANSNIMATNTETVTRNNSPGIQLGADYSIRKNQRVAVLLRGSRYNQQLHAYNTLFTTDAAARNVVSHTESNNNSVPVQRNFGANVYYSLDHRAGRLDVQGTLLSIRNQRHEDIQNKPIGQTEPESYWKTDMQNNILVRMAQADFSGNAGKGKLGAGAKFTFTTTNNDLRYDTLTSGGIFKPDSGRSNNFRYQEYITAGYISYSGSRNKLSYDLSLRVENTHTIAHAITTNEQHIRNYLTWLPSANVTYAWGSNRQINLSYSHRITRPEFSQLNPFRFYFSPLNYWEGNPNLRASTTKMLRLSYTQKTLNITAQLGRESDPMARYPEYDSATNILQYLGKNLPYNDFASLEISFPVTVTPWWKMQHTLRGNYKKEQMPYHNFTFAIPVTDYSVNGSQLFTLPKGITFDLSYYYRSHTGNSIYYIQPIGNIDLGIQKSWLKGALNSRINFYDVFDTQRVQLIFREKKIMNNRLQHWFGARRLVVALTYSFGKSTYKSKQSSRQEEEIRVGM